jgi:hypothetical protein
LILFLLLATGCGKVGDPKAPIIRIPQNIADLSARQDTLNIVLTWTNPATFIDANPVQGLSAVIIRNGKDLATVPVIDGGKPQTYVVDATDSVGVEQTFMLRFEAERGRTPGFSNSITFTPVDVPGEVSDIRGIADQFRIRLSWSPPKQNLALAQSYIVQRSDEPAPHVVSETTYEDPAVEAGKTYAYAVRAARGTDPLIPGPSIPAVMVVAMDKTAPRIPSGVVVETDAGVSGRVFVTWNDNGEADLAGYRVFRSEQQGGPWVQRTPMLVQKGFFDNDYVPGMYYAVIAEDFFGNQSMQSPPQRAP